MIDKTLAIPLAIKAGLGKYGRNGFLINTDFGPRVRLEKVLTNRPLALEKPVPFGVREFCQNCRKCSNSCPVSAIAKSAATNKPLNESNIKGITKWTVDGETFFSYWAAQNSDCSICIRVCPYNKDYSKWWNKLGIKLASTHLCGFMLWLNNKLKFGKRKQLIDWWKI
jgi:epoxyqueuosine reductase QueG